MVKNEPSDQEEGEGDIMAGRGSVMWPSQGHCTEIIFIDHSNIEGTRAVTCTLLQVNSSLKVIVTVFLFCIVFNKGEML